MGIWLSIRSNKPGATALTILNDGVRTGYMRESGGDWGMVDSQPIVSSSIDTEGGSVVGENVGNRQIVLPVLVYDTASSPTHAGLISAWQTFVGVVDEARRYKGRVRFRPSRASYAVEFEVEHARIEGDYWTKTAELGACVRVNLVLVCRPYALMDPMDLADDFSVNTLGTAGVYNSGGSDWSADGGALTNVAVSGGVLDASANLTTENRLIHTGTPHTYGDAQTSIQHTLGTTLTSYKAGVIVKRVDASNYIEVYVDDTGAASRLRIDKVVAGSRTNMASATPTRLTVSTTYWLVGRVEGNVVYAEHWTTPPTPSGTPSTTTNDTFDSTEAATFGETIEGRVGIVFTPQQTAASVGDFTVEAFTYKGTSYPDKLKLCGSIPGDETAPAAIAYTPAASPYGSCPTFAWWERLEPHNYVANGGFEENANGWSATAGELNGAGTSITRITTTFYEGTACGQLVTPATSDTGCYYRLYQRMKKGVTYTAELYAKSSGGSTTAMKLEMGRSGNAGSGTASALTTSWQRYTVSWTPTADVDWFDIAFTTNAATATTCQIDRVAAYEGTTAPTAWPLGVGGGSTLPGGVLPLGVVDAQQEYVDGGSGNFTQTSDAAAFAGVRSTANVSGATLTIPVAAWPLAKLARDGTFMVHVWAWFYLSSTTTGFNGVASFTSAANLVYSNEWGASGRSMQGYIPSAGSAWRPVSLGTFAMPVSEQPSDMVFDLSLFYGGTAPAIDYFVIAPADATCHYQRGSAVGSLFVNNATTRATVLDNLSGQREDFAAGSMQGATRAPGLVGSAIRLPRGDVDVLCVPANWPVDDPTSSASTPATVGYTGTIQFRVQPRVLMVGS